MKKQTEIFETDKATEKMSVCDECGDEMKSRSGKKYCSNTCRTKASMRRTLIGEGKGNASGAPETYTPLTGLNPQSQYIIKHQEGVINDWKTKCQSTEKELKDSQKKVRDLQDELTQLKTDQKIADSAKPSGLGAILETPFLQGLTPYIGPVIAELSKRVLMPSGEGNSDVKDLNDLVQWLASNKLEFQHKFHQMVHILSLIEDEDQRNMALDHIIKFLSNGKGSSNTTGNGSASASADIAM